MTSPQAIQQIMNQALVLQKQGKLAPALECFQQAYKAQSNHPDICHLYGLCLYQAQQFDDALSKLKKAVKRAPKAPQYRNSLAMALRKSGKVQEAIEQYLLALKLSPNYIDPLVNLGNVYRAEGNFSQAKQYLQRAAQLQPNNVNVLLNLGNVAQSEGDLPQAAQYYETAIKLQPKQGKALYNLALVLKLQEKHQLALNQIDHCLDLYPDYIAALMLRGEVLEHLGETQTAIECYERVLVLNQHFCAAYWSLANIGQYAFSQEQTDQLGYLSKQELPTQERCYILFALAKAQEANRDYTAAFSSLSQGNALKRQSIRYAAAENNRLMQTFKRAFTAEQLRHWLTEANKDIYQESQPTPIFVLGMPRSGTSLIEQVLASHTDVTAGGERDTSLSIIRDLLPALTSSSSQEALLSLDSKILQEAAHYYLQDNESWLTQTPFFTDKLPINFMHIGLLKGMFPQAKFVHIYKHPLDSCLSCFKQLFSGRQDFSYDLRELADFYADYRDIMQYWTELFTTLGLANDLIHISYEEFVEQPEPAIAALLQSLSLAWQPQCLTFHKTKRIVNTASSGQVRQPVYKSALSRWRYYENELKPLAALLEEKALLES